MGNTYGAAERHELKSLAGTLPEDAGPLVDAVADAMRLELPDMDDVAIGRVLLALRASRFGPVFAALPGEPVRVALVAAGLRLTRTEWEDTP